MRARTPAAVLLAAAALAAAGCGGGSSKPAALSHAELTKRADAACASASARVRALRAPTALDGLQQYATSVQSIGTELAGRLDRLTPPSADRVKLDAYRAALKQSNAIAGELADAAGSGNKTAVRSASDRLAESNLGVLAARAGLAQCATAVTLTST